MIKRFLVLIIFTLCVYFLYSQSRSGRIILLHTNDLHSNLNGFGPESEYDPCNNNTDITYGGFSRIAGIIDKERERNPDNVLVVDAGDFLMGTLFHTVELETGFQLPLMKKMGFDILGIGNHEFDFGPEKFAEIVNKSLEQGDIPKLTLANIRIPRKFRESEFNKLYENNIVEKYHIIERGGLRIGVFGLIGENADEVSPAKSPLEMRNYIRSARRVVRELRRNQNVDMIICLSHSGLKINEDGTYSGEDVRLAKRVSGIDIIVSGHSHHQIGQPVWINGTPIIQAGANGKYIGRFDIYFNNGAISLAKYQLLTVDDQVKANCDIQYKIDKQIKIIDDLILNKHGYSYHKPVATINYNFHKHKNNDISKGNLGPFLANAIHHYINNYSSDKVDISLIAAGVIRDDILMGKNGKLLPADIFRVVNLGMGNDDTPGYPLCKVYLTGRELKSLFEVLLIAPQQSEANYCFIAGAEVYYNSQNRFLRKIEKIIINDIEIDTERGNDKLFSVAANSYMLEFVGIIQSMTYGLVRITPKDAEGNKIENINDAIIEVQAEKKQKIEGKEWLAVLKYLEHIAKYHYDEETPISQYYRNPQNNWIKSK